jgi:DNA processing protein
LSLPPDAEDWLTLSFLPGLGCTLIHRLVQEAGTPQGVLRQGARLRNLPGIGSRTVAILTEGSQLKIARQRAQRELDQLVALSVTLLPCTSPRYPDSLRTIPDSPVLLYCRGDLSLLALPAVAIIGARTATEYGRRTSSLLAAELANRGVTIVSGGAYGIDAAAHRGALQNGGATVAVLGCGVDVIYPRSHAELFREILESGLLLSEYPLGTPPEGFRFPARNRIISGLAEGVVVVEATEKSGSLITARLALDQGREVFAVPGRVDSPKSAGPHRLIQQGAHLVHTAADIFDGLSWRGGTGTPLPLREQEATQGASSLTAREQQLLNCLEVYPRDIDNIARMTGCAIVELHGLLLQLELKGLVRQLPGQLYERMAAH